MLAQLHGKNCQNISQIASYYPHECWLSQSIDTHLNSLMQVRYWCSTTTSSIEYKDMQGCFENLVEDEYHLLLTWSMYKVIHEKYDAFLEEHDKISVI